MEEKKEKSEEKKEEKLKESKKTSDKIVLYLVLGIILAIAAIFSIRFFIPEETPKTIEDLHNLNLLGKLPDDQGHIVSGYSFVKIEDMWYTQVMSPQRTRQYDINFRFSPRDVEDIPLYGSFDVTDFDNASQYYVTFDPLGSQFKYVALGIADFNENMMKVFGKKPIAACDKNETEACKVRPIITCDNTDDIVLYVQESNTTMVSFDENCIIVQGSGFDIVRAVDRVLFLFYGILE